jgi:prepilin-type N-terminal cleavage/methylation domain-containing protein
VPPSAVDSAIGNEMQAFQTVMGCAVEWHMVCNLQARKEEVMNITKKMQRGFTLIEMLAAISIIAVLILPAVQ